MPSGLVKSPSLYENPMKRVRDGWKGELTDGGKRAIGKLGNAGRQVCAPYDVERTAIDSTVKKDTDALKDQAASKTTETGKSKTINKAKDFVPKPVRKAWNTYDDYNAVKQKGNEIKDAIPKDD